MILLPPDARSMAADFYQFGRGRSRHALVLITAGALLEGAGLLMLVPIVSLIMGDGGGLEILTAAGLSGMRSQVSVVLAGFALVLALRFAVILWRDDLLVSLELDFVADLRGRAFARLAAMPWAEVVTLRQSPVGHALTRDADRAATGAGQIVQALVALVLLIVQLAVAFMLAPVVTMAVFVLGLVLLRALRGMRLRAGQHGADLTAEDLAMYDATGAFLRGLKPAKAHGLESTYLAAFSGAARRVAKSHRAFAWDYTLTRLLLQSAAGVIAMGAILGGVFLLATPPENLIVALIVMARIYGPLQALQNTAQSIAHAAPAYRTIRDLAGPAGTLPTVFSEVGAKNNACLQTAPGFRLIDVGWSGDGAPVLTGITAEIPAGRVTAIAGESGAGKSTLLDLLTGLLTPVTGQIQLDNTPLDDARFEILRASLSYVGQEPFLFQASLRRNLTWGCGPVGEEEIWRALEITGAAAHARLLEGGLDGQIRPEGLRFSGGERQRIRLTRALLRRPKVLVLDEATNALDARAERQILGALLAARDGATVILVSHRATNLDFADNVITLEGGRIAAPSGGSPTTPMREGAAR